MSEQNEAGHTKGPWHVGYDNGEVFIHNDHATREAICRLDTGSVEADAALIAACPDMFAVLKHVLAMHDDAYLVGHPEWREIVTEARAAISKARLT